MKIVLIGAPASGKGTQGNFLKNTLGLVHISAGDILRKMMNEEGEINKIIRGYMLNAQMVPSEIISKAMAQRINEPDCKKGFIIDGYPRNVDQMEDLFKFTNIDCAILLNVPESKAVERIATRRVCEKCKVNYGVDYIDSKCECGGNLIKRLDDTAETVRKRYEEYVAQTIPVIEAIKRRTKLIEIDATKSVKEVSEEILRRLKNDIS